MTAPERGEERKVENNKWTLIYGGNPQMFNKRGVPVCLLKAASLLQSQTFFQILSIYYL